MNQKCQFWSSGVLKVHYLFAVFSFYVLFAELVFIAALMLTGMNVVFVLLFFEQLCQKA